MLRSDRFLSFLVSLWLFASASATHAQTGSLFAPALDFTVPENPYSVAVGDFNGDGILDLAASNFNNNTGDDGQVSVLMGNGDGTFQAPSNYAQGLKPYFAVTGDFNGDGRLDLGVCLKTRGMEGRVLGKWA